MRLSRRSVLTAGLAVAAGALLRPRLARAGSPKNLLIWWNAGGWDTTYVLDPHFGAALDNDPDSEPATTGSIFWADAESRPSVRRFFETWGSRAVVVNGLGVGSISHDGCTRLLLTGARQETGTDLGAIVAGATGADLAMPYAVLGGPRYPGALGELSTDVNSTFSSIVQGDLPVGSDLRREDAAAAWVAGEADALLAARERPRLRSWRQGLDRLAVVRAKADVLDAGEETSIADKVALARTLLQEGISRSLMFAPPRLQGTTWDSHSDNHEFQPRAWEGSFADLLVLLAALEAAPGASGTLLDDTLVVVASEMGRSPILNAQDGKDHWPTTSMILLGGGVEGGRTVGATDDQLTGAPMDLATGGLDPGGARLTVANLLSGLLSGFDVDPEAWFPGVVPLGGLFG